MNGILSNYIAEMRGENYIRVGGFGPITPPPPPSPTTQKSVAKHLAIARFIQGLPCSAKL